MCASPARGEKKRARAVVEERAFQKETLKFTYFLDLSFFFLNPKNTSERERERERKRKGNSLFFFTTLRNEHIHRAIGETKKKKKKKKKER